MKRHSLSLAIILLLLATAACEAGPRLGKNEVKIGKRAAASIDHAERPLKDGPAVVRVRRVGEVIASVANAKRVDATYGNSRITPFTYQFKVLPNADVNAFSVPGGFIYVTTGALSACETDDELAAIIAHEVVHCSHHHAVYVMRDANKTNFLTELLVVAAASLMKNPDDVQNLQIAGDVYMIAKVCGYGRKAETDADIAAMEYARQAGYNPVGMLTLMEKLAAHPRLVDFGIMKTHPDPEHRVKAIQERLAALGVPLDRRATAPSLGAIVAHSSHGSGVLWHRVVVSKSLICCVESETEAQELADRINRLLDAKVLQSYVTWIDAKVFCRREMLIEFRQSDAEAHKFTPTKYAEVTAARLQTAVTDLSIREMWKQEAGR